VGAPRTQVGRDRAERLAGVDGTVAVRPGVGVPRRAVLVDDVATTGATLGACAAALRAAGTYEVRAVTYARTPGR
jgi:predicted amidophosphoribosyltransferase